MAGIVGALALAIALLIAGCTGSATPVASPSPSPTVASPTATPEPSPSRSAAPQRPETMGRDDVEGAIAAAQYFLELYPYAYNTGDLTEWKALSHPECIFCASVVEGVEELHASGGYQTGGEIEWVSISARPGVSDGRAAVDLIARQKPTQQHTLGSSKEISAGGQARLFVDLVRGEGWLIRGVDVEVLDREVS